MDDLLFFFKGNITMARLCGYNRVPHAPVVDCLSTDL